MKKKLGLLASAAILSAVSAPAFSAEWSWNPYIGVDGGLRHLEFPQDLGGNIFDDNYPQGNLFAGFKFNDYFGVEAGFEYTKREKRTVTLVAGQFEAGGDALQPGQFQVNRGTGRVQAWHVNLVGTLPLSDCYPISLFGMVGLASVKAKFSSQPLADDAFPGGFPAGFGMRTFEKTKSVLRLAGGLQYMVLDCVGIRGMVSWENTNRLKNIYSKESAISQISLKNSTMYSFGIFYIFR